VRICGVSVLARQIRARHSADTVTVYQAYSPRIAVPAAAAGRFAAPFKRDRMTWVKPSFRWMMDRCGWATKPGRERVLAVEITRAGFERALARACLSHCDRELKTSPVRVRWDPERSPHRTLQLGLSGEAVGRYECTAAITDITPAAGRIRELARAGEHQDAAALLPPEHPYPLPDELRIHIGASRA
jgi:hypothetical protein